MWTLKGSAALENWQKDDICSAPMIHIFNTKFSNWHHCEQHCAKINSRIPSVVTFKEWELLQGFFKKNVYDKDLDIGELWLSITDEQEEGKWRDYITDKTMVHSGNFQKGQPNGEKGQNCVPLLRPSENGEWSAYVCNSFSISIMAFA